MARPDDPTTPVDPARSGRPPRRIGPYLIQREIATGGMGTVHEALQENPRRTVAVKILRQGMDSPEAVRRFEYESQILARLRHPGIAQVYEAGTHREGDSVVPYFAMEYIAGAKSLTGYARDKHLDVRARLELFAEVCDAVHHGHTKGIVHRDLKPSNILVDSSGHPRVIDFGVAHATDSDVALATVATQVGQLLGSVRYMSPEQFDADPHDLDTRSDVYTLGVILYELLAGEAPLDLSTATVYEAARRVKEDPPTRLGTRNPALKGDLDTIVHTALEKDRDRRYASANALAADIRHYLAGEAISARRPSLAYQVRVFARRNRALTGALAALFVLLMSGVAATTYLYLHAEQLRTDAERNATQAQKANDFLVEMIQETIPTDFGAEPATIDDLIELSRRKVPEVFPDEPEAQADMYRTLAWGYLNLSRMQDACDLFEKTYQIRKAALGPDDPSTFAAMREAARMFSLTGQNEKRIAILEEILAHTVAEYGEDSAESLRPEFSLAATLAEVGRIGDARSHAEHATEGFRRLEGPDGETTLEAEIYLAGLRLTQGATEEAEATSRDLLARCREAFGEDHETTRTARSQYAATLVTQGKFDEAADLYRDRPFPSDLGIAQAFQGTLEPAAHSAQLLVFWEPWCPFSQRLLPSLEQTYQRYRDQDLDVVAICQLNRTATPDAALDFITAKRLTYPCVYSDGTINAYYAQAGTPFVVLVRDGRQVWEGYTDLPGRVPSYLLDGLVGRVGS